MPRKLTLSIMSHDTGFISNLNQFGKERGLDITRQEIDYSTGWSDFMRMSIYGGSPDVSEIGSTWVNDFAAMNVLRSFSENELLRLGSADAFAPALWHTDPSSGTVWSIPWLSDIRLVFYRRDLLSKAGIDEPNAFQTADRFEQTLQKLQDTGIPHPLAIPTYSPYINIHNLAMWVWQAGEDLVDAQNKIVLFDRPKVRSAILAHLNLYRFISRENPHVEGDATSKFNSGKTAVTIDGSWGINAQSRSPEVAANLGLAIPLGCSYVGSSNLVIWKQSAQVLDSLNLIGYLTSREFFETVLPRMSNLLPGRLDSLEFYPLPDPSFYPLLEQALKTGRSLPNMYLWGLVEERLARAVTKLWEEIFATPKPDLEALYDKHIASMVHRLNITLSPP